MKGLLPLFGFIVTGLVGAFGNAKEGEVIDFARDVLPLLSDTCFTCHGPDENARKAKLRLDVREDAYGVIVPGSPRESEFVARILTDDPDEVMPPPDSTRQLSAEQIELLRAWVDQGAQWGKHWSYTPPVRPELPTTKLPVQNPIDYFVWARLEKEGLEPAPEASREKLLRRVTLDLTGLPPTAEELDHFLSDESPDAYAKVVRRLLDSPRFGERMAWEWLDVARYSDTNGFQGDPERTMWPWRDWVVRAYNDNLPFDRFTIEQLAGDLLPGATREQIIATGFNRNHMHNGEGGRIAEETRVENVFDRVETTATVWLGATFNCVRCHDHKYDPFTMADYFGMYDIFNQTSEAGRGRGGQIAPVLDVSTPEEAARVRASMERKRQVAGEVEAFELEKFPRPEGAPLKESEEARNLPGNLPRYIGETPPEKRSVSAILEAVSHFEKKDPPYAKLLNRLLAAEREREAASRAVTRVMIMDQLEEPRDTFILAGGLYNQPTDRKVSGSLPAVLVEEQPSPRADRLDLAEWFVSPENPLTARVTVNRFWQMLFGTGLVKTSEDFGVQGERPSHPGLLDWLAVEFMESGWDVKALLELIVTSSTYRQDSAIERDLLEKDPENRLLTRGARFRMPSWMIRDLSLATGGLLVDRLGGPPVKPYQPEGVWAEATFGKKKYQQDEGDALYRRSLYVFWRRIVGPTMFFDVSARQTCSVKPLRTNTPLHALTTLNDITYVEAARVMAERILLEEKDQPIQTAFRLAVSREPSAMETGVLSRHLEKLRRQYQEDPEAASRLIGVGDSTPSPDIDPVELAAFAGLCSLILNLDETLTRE